MLVENNRPLERVAPRRWNVVALLLVISCVAAVASLRAEQGEPVESALKASANADVNEVPLELRPERIREVAKQHFQLTLDAELADLQRQLARLKRAESANGGEPDMLLERQIETLELNIALRKAQLSRLRYGSITKPLSSLEQFLRIEDELRQLRAIQNGLATQPDKEEEARRVSKEILRCEQDIHELLKMHRAANADGTAGNPNELPGTIRRPSDKQIESLLADDSLIGQLTEQLRAYHDQLQRVGAVAAPNSNFINQLQREILRIEEAINERKAELRAKAAEFLQHSTQSEAATVAATPYANPPFSGTIRPGDILHIEIGGLQSGDINVHRVVEPDGNVAISAALGGWRLKVTGDSLTEAGKRIRERISEQIQSTRPITVLVTHASQDDGVVPIEEEKSAPTTDSLIPIAKDILKPLDTIEVTMPLKPDAYRFMVNGKTVHGNSDDKSVVSGTYLIDPDGTISLPEALGRVAIANKTRAAAALAIREHLSAISASPIALPLAEVVRRGRAVFPEGKMPDADYRIQPGDKLLVSMSGRLIQAHEMRVSEQGILHRDTRNSRGISVTGMTLSELETAMRENWKSALKDYDSDWKEVPRLIPWTVTVGDWHEEADPATIHRIDGGEGIVAAEHGKSTQPAQPQVLPGIIVKPLDTIEVTLGAEMNNAAFPSGTYLIEPDGSVALFDRRLKLADMTEREAGAALRAYMSAQPWLLKAPPSIHVQRRGHAVFPENKTPTADYRVQPGDQLLANSSGSPVEAMRLTVSGDGLLTYPEEFPFAKLAPVRVEGKTLDEVQEVLRANWKFPNGGPQNLVEYPWTVTLGGWHEEADPAVIDRIESGDSPRVEQLEQELREIKALIRAMDR